MSKKPTLKSTVTGDKLVIELSLKEILAQVGAWNRSVNAGNQKDPTGEMPLFRVTNAQAFLKCLRPFLMNVGGGDMRLQDVVGMAIEDCLEHAAKKGAGIVELPWTATDAYGLKPVGKKKKRR